MSDDIVKVIWAEIEIEIYQYEDGKFDWWSSNGDNSSQLFDSADDAEADARRRYQ